MGKKRNNDDNYYRYVETSTTSDTKRKVDKQIIFNRIKAVIVLAIIAFSVWAIVNRVKNSAQAKSNIDYKSNLTVEFLAKRNLSDFIENMDGKLVYDFQVDTTKLGEQEITFNYLNEKNKRKTDTFTINVVDTVKPKVLGNTSITYFKDHEVDLHQNFFSGDLCDPNPKREIIGDYDFKTVGDYNLVYRVTDKSNNVNNFKFTLHIINNSSSTRKATTTENANENDNTPTRKFKDDVQLYKNDNTKLGIDVSYFQGNIDWAKVKEAGCDFAIIRVGYQKGFDKGIEEDSYFDNNIQGAIAQGIDLGFYFYSYAKTTDEARQQAKWTIEQIKKYGLTETALPICFDWESWDKFSELEISLYEMNHIAQEFNKEIEDAGFEGALYSSTNYMNRVWLDEYVKNVWIASYVEKTNYMGKYYMWQYSNKGIIDGINGNVDLNILYINKY